MPSFKIRASLLASIAAAATLAAPPVTLAQQAPARAAAKPFLPASSPEAQGVDGARLRLLKQRLDEGVKAGELPGARIIVVRNGNVIMDDTVGYADVAAKQPMNADTVFAIASLTKIFTSVAVMQLVEDGKLHLSDPVWVYLPELKDMKVAEMGGPDGRTMKLVPPERDVTVQDLMSHTAGYVNPGNADTAVHKMYETLVGQPNLKAYITALSKLPLAHQPGSTWEYSPSVDVLGRVVEVVSGQTFDQYLIDHVTGPLGLKSVAFHVVTPDNFAKRLPSAEAGGRGAITQNPGLLQGGGGLYAAPRDVARLGQMLLNGGTLDQARILGPKTIALMTANALGPCTAVPAYTALGQGFMTPTSEMGQGFGLGFAIRTSPGRNPLPGSVGEFYWAGASGTYLWMDPQEKLVVMLATAQAQADVKWKFRQVTREIIYGSLKTIYPPLAQNPAGEAASACVYDTRRPAQATLGSSRP